MTRERSVREVMSRHAKRAWPMKGKTVAQRRESMLNAIRNDLIALSERIMLEGSYGEIRGELTLWLRIIRCNNRRAYGVRIETVEICQELLEHWMEQNSLIAKAVSDWAAPIARDAHAGIGQTLAQGLQTLAKQYFAMQEMKAASVKRQRVLF